MGQVIIVVIFSLIIKCLLFFLLPHSGNFLLEFSIYILTVCTFYQWKKSPGSVFILATSPVFLWPGNPDPKFAVFLLGLGGSLFGKHQVLSLSALLISLILFVHPVTSFSFIRNPAIPATINQLRGEDWKFGFPPAARILHNKLGYFTAFTASFMQDINFTAHFGLGDKDETSNSQWIPPLLLPTLPLLLLSIYHWRKSSIAIWSVTLFGLLLGVLSGPKFTENHFLLFYAGIVTIAGAQLDRLQVPIRYLPKITSVILLIPMVFFSTSYRPRPLLIATGYGLNQIAAYSRTHPGQTILLSDNLYPQVGPLPANVIVLPATNPRFLPPVPDHTTLLVPIAPPQPKDSVYSPVLQPFIADLAQQPLLFILTYVPK